MVTYTTQTVTWVKYKSYVFRHPKLPKMGTGKIRYLVNWGLAPYFRGKLVEDVNRSKVLSVGFDESLNQISQILGC